MRYSIAALALVGAVAALPNVLRDVAVETDVKVVQEVQWVTDVVTVTGAPPAAAATPAPSPVAAAQKNGKQQAAPAAPAPTTFVQVVTQAPPAPAAPSPAPAAQAPAPAAQSSSNSDPNSSDAILAVANKWRSAYGLKTFTWDNELQGNAQKTGNDDNGTDEKHELNGNSMAQVITPGINSCSNKNCDGLSSPFELAYLSGWLCERSSAPALAGKCPGAVAAASMSLGTETGHADILTNKDYTKIGCAFSGNGQPASAQWTGLWICDLA